MRVVSLVPAATEMVAALGAVDDLVAVTHDCDHPQRVQELPRITRSTIAAGSTSGEIDRAVRVAAEHGESTFHLDADALAHAKPDILLGQTLCNVCAVTLAQLPASLSRRPSVVPLDGGSLDGIFEDTLRVGDALGRARDAAALVARLRARIAEVERRVAGASRPSVVCLEWLDPPFNAGHWVPEQVAHAGGRDVLGVAGARSDEVTLDHVLEADPDYVFVMPCGFDIDRAQLELRAVTHDPRWSAMRAVHVGNAYALDGNAYFSRPGPRVVDGIELLASILHPDRVRSDVRRARITP